jgi:hypothetical protein
MLGVMAHIELGNDYPGIRALLVYRPETAEPLAAFMETLMRGDTANNCIT